MTTTRAVPGILALLALWSATPLVCLELARADGPPPASPAPAEPPACPPAPAPAPAPASAPAQGKQEPKAKGGVDVGHMHNVHQITPRFWRGSQPETEDDLVELARRGIKVVVSVDGAKPMAELARKHGMRYVHVPMGYNGLSREKEVLLYKAYTTLEGPFYVHCHHGKHRGPAACVPALVGVEGWTPERAVAELKLAGTAPKYQGLYALPAQFVKPTAEELARAPAEIPEVMPVPALQEAMVELDQGWVRLAEVKQAGWTAPAEHPDVAPPHEATILAEYLRELARRDEIKQKPAEFLAFLAAGERAAWELAEALKAKPVNATAAEAAYKLVEASCADCHKAYRDNAPVR